MAVRKQALTFAIPEAKGVNISLVELDDGRLVARTDDELEAAGDVAERLEREEEED